MSARDDYPLLAAGATNAFNAASRDELSGALDEIDRLRDWQKRAADLLAEEWYDHEDGGYWQELTKPFIRPLLAEAGIELEA